MDCDVTVLYNSLAKWIDFCCFHYKIYVLGRWIAQGRSKKQNMEANAAVIYIFIKW